MAGHEARLRAFLANRSDLRLVAEFHDTPWRSSRPALAQALRSARAGDFDTLLITEPCHISRRIRALTDFLHDFHEAGVTVCSVAGGIDTSVPVGRLALAVFAALAGAETDSRTTHDRPVATPDSSGWRVTAGRRRRTRAVSGTSRTRRTDPPDDSRTRLRGD
jgi:hypothetical protein